MTEQEARALLGLPEPTEKVYDRQAHILKPPMPEVTNRRRGKAMGAVSDFLADIDKRSRSAQNALVDRLMPQGGPNVPFPVGVSLYPTMTSSGEINQPKGLETVPLPLADIAKTIQASDLMGIGGAGRALNEFSYGDVPKDPYDIADMAMLAPGIAGLIGAGVRGAKGAGRAAKNLAKSDAGYRLANRVADATGASGLGIIKNPGGNWLTQVDENIGFGPAAIEGPEGFYKRNLSNVARDQARMADALERAERFAARYGPDNELAQANLLEAKTIEGRLAAYRWANGPLKKYVRNDLATENDPIRKLIEQGISHLTEEDMDAAIAQGVRHQAEANRMTTGYPRHGISPTEEGGLYESIADASIKPLSVERMMSPRFASEETRNLILEKNPWIAKLYNDPAADPNTMTYQLNQYLGSTPLGFGTLIDNIVEDVAAGRLDPKDINKYSVEAAVIRADAIRKEKELEIARELAATRKDLPVVKEYPEGYKWVELNKPGSFAAESNAMEHSVRGYEPEPGHDDWVKISGNQGDPNYGHGGWEAIKSGRAKVYSLIDETGTPHVTVETLEPTDAMRRQASKDFYAREGRWPSGQEIEQNNASIPYIATQVKRKFNDVDSADYLQKKYVTDFMRHKNFNLSNLRDDIANTGLYKKSEAVTPEEEQALIAAGHSVPDYLTMEEVQKFREGRPWKPIDTTPELDIDVNPDLPDFQPYEGYKEGGEVHAAGGGLIKALAMVNKALAEARAAGKVIEQVPTDRLSMTHKDVTKRVPELTAAAKLLQEGKITKEEYVEMVKAFKPVQPFAEVPRAATKEEMLKALAENQRDKLYKTRDIEEGYPVGGRLNIPAYSNHGVWIPTLHEQVPGFRAGPVIGYDSHFRVGDAIFGVEPKSALNYATGKTSKGTFATIKGNFKRTADDEVMDLAREMMSDPRYRQIGMDPERSSLFYDRGTFEPVGEAEDVLQVGPLVFARNPRPPSKKQLEDAPYATGGTAAYKE